MLRQFVPQEVCLKCSGCCRFKEEDSVWAPCLLDEEIQRLLDKRDLPSAFISVNKRIKPLPHPEGAGFICTFFELKENKCKIYPFRPMECQLYPFLLSMRNKNVILTVDLNCPYAKANLTTPPMRDYLEYLSTFLNSPAQKRKLKDNPQLLQTYEEALDIMELNTADEAE